MLLVSSIIQNTLQMFRAQKRLADASEKVKQLKIEQQKLIQDKNKQNSQDYIEAQIRNKLKLIKNGEIVVVLPSILQKQQQDDLYKYSPEDSKLETKNNYQEWLNLFL